MIKKIVKFIPVVCMLLVNSITFANKLPNVVIKEITAVEKRLGANVGVAVYDTKDHRISEYNGDKRFPLMSTFKTLAAANILYKTDQRLLSLEKKISIHEDEILSYAPVTKEFVGETMKLNEVCSAAMSMSDNTAANIMLENLGGPQELTKFLREIGDTTTRIDRIEPELNEALKGDERDTTTPKAIVKTLNKLLYGKVLSNTSKEQLKKWMMDNKVADNLFRAVLPKKYLIADRSGAGGYGSRGITAVVWSEDRTPIIISVYLTQTDATFVERNEAIVQIGDVIFNEYLKN
ncbi:class A beta-lactamase [Psychrilyobacter atlanticus]|uniref:class A beta-lactamase n=1 Tax=Psychrilyobacter atlanticus TaxID=271091 RepID=UPI000426D91E|nr:class A beta-lactamase [Psychrilyobacter atlanticus]